MKSNYKKLAPYIRLVDIRNTSDERYDLLGVSVDKHFIKSIANTIGTDWRTYKVIQKGQFCYIPDTSRRGDKMGIALLTDYDIALVSQAYTVFEIINQEQLLPEYLNLWFKRPEFDRYARFHSHGSVREIFDWEEMCNVELPVPEIEEQRKIVEAYNTIERRIALKRKINDNLEAQAITLFKELQSNLPLSIPLEEFVNYQEGPGIRNWQLVDDGIPFVNIRCLVNNDIDTTICNKISYQEASTTYKHFMLNVGDIIMSISGTLGKIAIIREEHLPLCLNTSIMRFTPKIQKDDYAYLLYYLSSTEFANCLMSQATGSAQLNFGPTHIKRLTVNLPSKEQRILFNRLVMPLIIAQNTNKREIKLLEQLMANCLAILSR